MAEIVEQVEEIKGNQSLTKFERETIISCNDEDNKWYIYTSQQPTIRRLLKNPLFELQDKQFNKVYSCYPNPISIEGFLPHKAITVRTKKKTVKPLTDEQREVLKQRLKKARESIKRANTL